ncbi:MAG: hypothetical protein ACLTZT_09830 [Butyricimonas faecalis]
MQDSLGYSAYQTGFSSCPWDFYRPWHPVGGKCFPVGEPESGDRAGIIPAMCQLLHELLFSFLTDKWYIMVSLYLSRVGNPLPPLLNVSLRQIDNRQMAQASSVTNIVRQIGGSFGSHVQPFVEPAQTYHRSVITKLLPTREKLIRTWWTG